MLNLVENLKLSCVLCEQLAAKCIAFHGTISLELDQDARMKKGKYLRKLWENLTQGSTCHKGWEFCRLHYFFQICLENYPPTLHLNVQHGSSVVAVESQHWWLMTQLTQLHMSQSWTWQVVMLLKQNDSALDDALLGVEGLMSWLHHYILFPQSLPLIGLYNPIITSSSLLLLMHRNRLQPSRRMDNPGCCCSFCQTKIETGIRAKNNLVFVFDNWPFQRRSILASSQQPSLHLIARYLQK